VRSRRRRAAANRSTGSFTTQHVTEAEPDGVDLNLRGTRGATVFWLGHSGAPRNSSRRALRNRADRVIQLGQGVIDSGQAATRGFFGFSSLAEIGTDRVRLLAGLAAPI